jgi:DNA-binding NtrC family response regulator
MQLLLVDDDHDFRETAAAWLRRHGHEVHTAPDGRSALEVARRQACDVAVLDLRLPDLSGIDLLSALKGLSEELEIVLLTGSGTIETAVEAMRRGAYDYLTKPFPLARLEERCRLAGDHARLLRENRQLKALLRRDRGTSELLGDSAPMQEVRRLIGRVAPTDKPVLILGESGTGKELVARGVQEQSHRAGKPFVVINCAALPETLVESELFGHEKGAFTGAVVRKDGLFDVADGGTLFIDEIGELPLALQPKLLRVLENGTFRRIGSHQERKVDVRLIAATHRELPAEVAAGRFREDLFYRINVLTIRLPPLRERRDDLPRLVARYLPPEWELEPDVWRVLRDYPWPGNVRELINVLERAAILADDRLVTIDDLPAELVTRGSLTAARPMADIEPPTERLDDWERSHVIKVLQQARGNKSLAARQLGVHRRTLYRLLERLGIGDAPH